MTNLFERKSEGPDFGETGDEGRVSGGPTGIEVMETVDEVTGLLIQNPFGDPPAGEVVVNKILVRKIGIAAGAQGPFKFVDADLRKTFAIGLLDTIIGQLRAGGYPQGSAPYGGGPHDGPLDVHCDGTTIFVFALVDPGDGRKFRFSRSTKAISLGGVPLGDQPNYFSLFHVAQTGDPTKGHHANQDCRIAYFTAKQTSQDFHHAFNLHVEIVYPTAAGGEYAMPIIIDPDVRYPGGSG